jgi:xylulokinase
VPLVAGVDSSTQSVKVEIRDADTGEILTSGRAMHPPTSPPRSEQDPEAWWRAFEQAWESAAAPSVAAISVAAQQHGMVTVDAEDRVVRPAKLWNDTESAADAAWLVERLGGPAAAAEALGSVPTASFTVTKLSWMHRCEPEAWARLRRVSLPHDWLTHRLTGRWTTDRGDASGTGYWSPSAGSYRYDVLDVVDAGVDWRAALPAVLGPGEVAGTWQSAVVAPGTGDNMGSALALALQPGDVVISLGTSGTVYALSAVPAADPSGIVAGFASADGRFLPLVCTLNATKVTDAVARLLGVDHHTFDQLALAAPVGARGLVLLPYLDGERTPNRPAATGVLAGVRSDVSREQIARAAVEGVICGLLHGLDALSSHVAVDGRLLLVGGGARSLAYRQALADLAEREVIVPVGEELVATGAAVQAAAVLGGHEAVDVATAWQASEGCEVVRPAPGSSSLAAAARAAHAERREREAM